MLEEIKVMFPRHKLKHTGTHFYLQQDTTAQPVALSIVTNIMSLACSALFYLMHGGP
jgi:hypothetical protein